VTNSGVLQGRVPWYPGRDGDAPEVPHIPPPQVELA